MPRRRRGTRCCERCCRASSSALCCQMTLRPPTRQGASAVACLLVSALRFYFCSLSIVLSLLVLILILLLLFLSLLFLRLLLLLLPLLLLLLVLRLLLLRPLRYCFVLGLAVVSVFFDTCSWSWSWSSSGLSFRFALVCAVAVDMKVFGQRVRWQAFFCVLLTPVTSSAHDDRPIQLPPLPLPPYCLHRCLQTPQLPPSPPLHAMPWCTCYRRITTARPTAPGRPVSSRSGCNRP
jgi:hypothetical protein